MNESHEHFAGKDALGHVAEAQAKGIISTAEIHGTETPGHISAGCDASRETAIVLLIFWLILAHYAVLHLEIAKFTLILGFGWLLWKTGRSAWLAWFRLERMHRIVEQERWEIKHHRQQEREELRELYRAKGFEGKLLEDVVDVLMADEERLLRVMVEEELCLSVESQEHPIKQAIGAAIGVLCTTTLCLLFAWAEPNYGIWAGSFASIAASAALCAYYEQNRIIPAIIWNLGIGAAASGSIYLLFNYLG